MPDRKDLVGRETGNYRLIQRIGSGSFAEVYLGEQIYLRSYAAIKVLHAALDPAAAQNFQREARILRKLRHPNIISLLDFGVDEQGQPYLIMDYAPGGSLRSRYPKGTRVPLADILKYVNEAAEALDYAHNQGFVHRDIKPANMLIGESGEILVSDFGIASIVPGRDPHASDDSLWRRSFPGVAGTPAYMAPEQLEGRAEPASDQYALATIVYQWLCGALPFDGKNWLEIAARRASSDPPPPRDFNPAISTELEDVVLTGLARDPRHRYASVRAFADALIEAAQHTPGVDVRLTAPHAPGKTVSHVPSADARSVPNVDTRPLPGADARFIAPSRLSTGRANAIKNITNQEQPHHPEQQACHPERSEGSHPTKEGRVPLGRQSFATAQDDTQLFPMSDINPHHPAPIPPRATQHAPGVNAQPLPGVDARFIAPSHPLAGAQLIDHPTDQTKPAPTLLLGRRTILAGMGAVLVAAGAGFALTHLGPRMPDASHASAKNLRTPGVPHTTTTPAPQQTQGTTPPNTPALTTLHIYSGHRDIVDAVAWSPDGHYIVSGSLDHTAQLWDANSAQHLLTHQHGDTISSVTWSSDSQFIASGSYDKTVQIWGVNQGASTSITYNNLNKDITSVAWSPLSGRIAVTVLDGDEVDIFDPTTGNTITFYHLQSNSIYAVAWSHDGTHIATGSGGGTGASVQIWDVTTNSRIASYSGHTGGVFSVAWSPDGRYVASGGFDKTVRIWEVASGNQVQMYEGHHDVVNAVAWSPDGRYVASAGNDRTVQVWTAAAGIPLHTYNQHLDSVRAIAWSPDSTRIASASSDKTVRVWQAV